MKINPAQSQAMEAAKAGRTQEQQSPKGSQITKREVAPGARTEISSRAQEMGLAKKIATETSEVNPEREAKIAELRRRIENREYNVKPEAIADKMIQEHKETQGIG